MRNILRIWRIWMWDTGPGSMDMKTGMYLMPWYTMWEAVPADQDIISSRSGILPEIIFIWYTKICRCYRLLSIFRFLLWDLESKFCFLRWKDSEESILRELRMDSRSVKKIIKYLLNFKICQTILEFKLNCGWISSGVCADDKKER